MDKQSLRTEAKRHRDFIDPKDDNPENAVDHFLKAIPLLKGQILAGYWPKGREFDPRPIMDEAAGKGCRLCLPVIQKDSRILKFSKWSDGDVLQENDFRIMEPVSTDWVKPDIVLVPMLAFDRKGYRLGYGGGYYDATLKNLKEKKSIISIGLGYAQQAVLFNLPVEDHDQRMDWIITPQNATQHLAEGAA